MSMIHLLSCVMMGVTAAQPAGFSESQENEVLTYDFPFVTRSQWLARPPKETLKLQTPVPYVVIHHSYIPGACNNLEECSNAMRVMQDMHIDKNGWWDIGYNFAVGGDGAGYEGRGWDILGAHALHFNTVSIGICLIGDWTSSLPPASQMKTAKAIIEAGVEMGYIQPDYRLVGHRQVRATECPGETLFQEIKSWDHYSNFPASRKDLPKVKELPESTKDELRKQMNIN